MIQIENDTVWIEFKKGPASHNPQACIMLAMEILNTSKAFSSIIRKGQKPGKKMEKTGRIREGISKIVNKTDVTPELLDNLVRHIRTGQVKEVTAIIGDQMIDLSPGDTSEVVAKLMVEKVI